MRDIDLVFQWLDYQQHNLGRQAGTVTKYLAYMQRLIVSLQAKDKQLLQATIDDLEAFTGPEAHQSGMQARSRRPLVAAVRGFYAWARSAGLINQDPSINLPYPRVSKKLPKGMDIGNAERLLLQPDLETFIGVRDAAMLSTFMGCGLRLSGLIRLNESDLIWTRDTATDGERLVIRVTEKANKERYLPAPHEVRLMIRIYLGHPDLKGIDRRLPNGDQVLFVSTMSRMIPPHEYYGEARRISKRAVADMMTKYGNQAGIPMDQCTPHKLRHLYGTEMVEDDVQMFKVQALMGHADPKTTNEYVHVALRSLSKVVDQSNPLSKIKTPVTELAKQLR